MNLNEVSIKKGYRSKKEILDANGEGTGEFRQIGHYSVRLKAPVNKRGGMDIEFNPEHPTIKARIRIKLIADLDKNGNEYTGNNRYSTVCEHDLMVCESYASLWEIAQGKAFVIYNDLCEYPCNLREDENKPYQSFEGWIIPPPENKEDDEPSVMDDEYAPDYATTDDVSDSVPDVEGATANEQYVAPYPWWHFWRWF